MGQIFKKGEVVQLKSGGPKMTIECYTMILGWDSNYESQEVVECTWFDNEEKLQHRHFQQEALRLIGNDDE